MGTAEAARPPEQTLEEELFALLYRQSRRLPIPIFLAAAMIAWLSGYPGAPSAAALAWLLGCAVLLWARRNLLGSLVHQRHIPAQRRLRKAVMLNTVHGAVYAVALLLFEHDALLPLAIASLLLVGLCAGSVVTTAGHRSLFLVVAGQVMAALVARWLLAAFEPQHQSVALATAAILALFATVLVSLAADSFRLFSDSFNIRLQQAELNQSLRVALDRAEAASRAKTRFLASASHDLRQPIHTLSLFAASLGMRPLDPVTREISQHIDAALQGLSTQLDGLLDISKLDAGIVAVAPQQVDLALLCAQLEQQYAPLAHQRGLQFVLQADADAAVRSDPALLARVLGNLLDNAIKYTPHGKVVLSLSASPDRAIVAVEDSGIGIPEDEQERVFEEFYQLGNPERNRTMGLGLGLSIVARLVSLLDLRIELVSRAGGGCAFYLILPLLPSCVRPDVGAPPRALAAQRYAGHVLVVDDESSVRQGMRILLEGLGVRVSLADGIEQALAVAQRDPPDLLLSDFRLRGEESGIGVIDAVRACVPEVAAALISGDTSPERLREAHAANLLLLHKPVPLERLRQVLAVMAERDTVPEEIVHER